MDREDKALRVGLAKVAQDLEGVLEEINTTFQVLKERGVGHLPVDPTTEDEAQLPRPGIPGEGTKPVVGGGQSLGRGLSGFPPGGGADSGPVEARPARTSLEVTLSSAIPVGPEIKEEPSLERLSHFVSGCHRCALAKKRKHVVFGDGSAQARVLFVGEGPGATEDETGRPFVGKAGQLLTSMLTAIGVDRRDIYITNIVKCRPPGNRDPKTEETAACRPFLDRQREILSPPVVVTLGRPAAQSLLQTTASLAQLRGRFHPFHGGVLLVTYHPAYLLRAPTKKAEAWQDLKLLRQYLAEQGLADPLPLAWWQEVCG